MEVGDYITSKSYANKGKGCILSISEIAGSKTYTVFFESTKEVLSLNEADILNITKQHSIVEQNIHDINFVKMMEQKQVLKI